MSKLSVVLAVLLSSLLSNVADYDAGFIEGGHAALREVQSDLCVARPDIDWSFCK